MNRLHNQTIAILGGTGAEGAGLAMRWARAGLRVIVGSRLADKGADGAQVGELLGLSSSRAVRRLLKQEPRTLETLARELV